MNDGDRKFNTLWGWQPGGGGDRQLEENTTGLDWRLEVAELAEYWFMMCRWENKDED